MRYNINARLIYDAADGTLMLPDSDTPDAQLSITANALLFFFLRNTAVVSREEVLKKVWDDNGLTSSNSNLNQYLSMLRKTFRHYHIDNIIVTISRGNLQLNPAIVVETLVESPIPLLAAPDPCHEVAAPKENSPNPPCPQHERGMCWYMASAALLAISCLLVGFALVGRVASHPISLTPLTQHECALLASEDMLSSVAGNAYRKNFDAVRQRLKLTCKPGEQFYFFYGDKLQTNGLGRVFLVHCAMYENNPFSYCDNYFYYAWNPQ